MKRAIPAAVATMALLAVAAPAISGAAQQPGNSLLTGAPGLQTSYEGLVDYASHGSVKVRARNRFSREEAMTLTNSTTATLIGLPQQTGKP